MIMVIFKKGLRRIRKSLFLTLLLIFLTFQNNLFSENTYQDTIKVHNLCKCSQKSCCENSNLETENISCKCCISSEEPLEKNSFVVLISNNKQNEITKVSENITSIIQVFKRYNEIIPYQNLNFPPIYILVKNLLI